MTVSSEQALISSIFVLNSANKSELYHALTEDDFELYRKESSFLWDFRRKYGDFPALTTFKDRFPLFEVDAGSEPFRYYMADIRAQKTQITINKTIGSLVGQIKNGMPVTSQVETIRKLAKSLDSAEAKMGHWDWASDESRIDRYSEGADVGSRFLVLPIHGLRKLIKRLYPGEFLGCAALPRIGKTWFSCYIAADSAHRQKLRTALISLEISEEEMSDRCDAIMFKMNWPRFRQKELTVREKFLYKMAVRRLNKNSEDVCLHFYGAKRADKFTLGYVDSLIAGKGYDVVIIDGIHLIDTPGMVGPEAAYYKTAELKKMCGRSSIMAIATTHIDGNLEEAGSGGKQKKAGGISKVSWGKSMGRDADYFVEMMAPDGAGSPMRTFVVDKARNDKMGAASVMFSVEPVQFYENLGATEIEVYIGNILTNPSIMNPVTHKYKRAPEIIGDRITAVAMALRSLA